MCVLTTLLHEQVFSCAYAPSQSSSTVWGPNWFAPISFSCHVSRPHPIWHTVADLFSLPRFPSLSSLECECIRPLCRATWVRCLINIHHSTVEKKRLLSVLYSLKVSLPLREWRECMCPVPRNCLPALSWQPSQPTLTLHCLGKLDKWIIQSLL